MCVYVWGGVCESPCVCVYSVCSCLGMFEYVPVCVTVCMCAYILVCI